jgi:hypothetical protein
VVQDVLQCIYHIIYIHHILYIIYIHIYTHIYQNQQTALHLAAERGHGKIVETLVEAKADLCAQDNVSVLTETRQTADRGMR